MSKHTCPLHAECSTVFDQENGMTPMPHPPYSPYLAPSNLFLFPQMKKVLKGKRSANVEEVKQKTAEE